VGLCCLGLYIFIIFIYLKRLHPLKSIKPVSGCKKFKNKLDKSNYCSGSGKKLVAGR
jgi:hypothetical protein